MAQTIVEDLEFINVNKQHRESEIRVPPRLSNGALQPVEKKRPVREVRQAVVKGQVVQLFLGPLPLGNVSVPDDQPFSLAFRAANSASGRLENAPGAILVADAVFQPFAPAGEASFLGGL